MGDCRGLAVALAIEGLLSGGWGWRSSVLEMGRVEGSGVVVGVVVWLMVGVEWRSSC